MITARFDGGRTVNAMLVDEPQSDLLGIVQCNNCEASMVLYGYMGDAQIANEITDFALEHDCKGKPQIAMTKAELLDAIRKAKKTGV